MTIAKKRNNAINILHMGGGGRLNSLFLGYFPLTQGVTTRCSLAAGLRGNGERMRK